MRALVVDDSATMRIVLSRLLGAHGFEVRAADGGAAALDVLSSDWAPELFLFDWNMPDITGLDLIAAVRAQARFADAKILMVTSETDMALMQHAVHAGANEYLMRPVNATNLAEKLELLGLHPTVAP
jgi:two-component system chemotaxis response regulator CheY